MEIQNKVFLYTYPDSLGGNLKTLNTVVETYLQQAIGGIYILPFYPSSGDRGFAALTHLEVDSQFGNWQDINKLADKYFLMSDVIVNHISTKSIYFQDYIHKHQESEYADMFMPLNKIYKDGCITLDELALTSLFGDIPSIINYKFDDGSTQTHWKTFFESQAELDQDSPLVQKLMEEYFANLAKHGIKALRLDAVHVTAKDRSQKPLMIEQTYAQIEKFVKLAKKYDMAVLCEVYADSKKLTRLNDLGAWTYDFYLPGLTLNAIFKRNAKYLKKWLMTARNRQVTVLGLHDSIQAGFGFLKEVLPPEEEEFTRAKIFYNAGKSTEIASGTKANNVDTRGINATFYEALYRNQDTWLMANTIHMFAPGVPHVYYNDLLAQRNDEKRFSQTGEGRSIMRHNHTLSGLDHKFKQPFVERFIKLMKFRNSYPAFDGQIKVQDSAEDNLIVTWSKDEFSTTLNMDLGRFEASIEYWDENIQAYKSFKV